VVPLLSQSYAAIQATPPGLTATFSIGYTKEYLKEIKSTKLSNITWRIYGHGRYDGWLYGHTLNGEFTGDNITYIYDDLKTSLLGRFEKGLMVSARKVKIKGYRYFGKLTMTKDLDIKIFFFEVQQRISRSPVHKTKSKWTIL